MILERWKERARELKTETYALYLAVKDPRVPWYAKFCALCVVAYALSPIDLIPDFIPVLGYLDDLILVPIGIALTIKMIPPRVLAECRAKAQIRIAQSGFLGRIGAAFIIAIWLTITVWLFLYFKSNWGTTVNRTASPDFSFCAILRPIPGNLYMSQILIQQYLNQLQDLRKVSGTHREMVVREAFKDLLKGWARSHDLIFVPEYEIATPAKDRRYVDGALVHALRVPFGYWEAKDEKDDLDAEIELKKRRGYPQDNIIFEDSNRAVLVQEKEEVYRCPVDDVKGLENY